ncbi:MAG: PAS domain S-box protein [Candidatus Hydrogenedentes bacterium]|nr:PAS domain S-box protein [Candidatus Hydrogenedentota bacterium]
MGHGYTQIIQSAALRIVEAAIEYTDVDDFEQPLHSLVAELPSSIANETGVDVASLRDHGADPATTSRLLRAVEAETINVLRENYGEEDFHEIVLALRRCIRKSLPERPLNPEGVRLYQGLVGASVEETKPETRRLYSLLKGILRSIRDMVYVHDTLGNFLYVNDRGLEMTRYTRDDLVNGMSVFDMVAPEYLDLVEERMASSPGRSSPYSIEIFTKDGDRVPIEIDTRVMFGERGRPDAVVGVARDLRLERRLQEDIVRTNRYFEHLMGNTSHGVIVIDLQGNIRDVNACALAQSGATSATSLIGHNIRNVCEQDEEKISQVIQSVCEQRKILKSPLAVRTRFGGEIKGEVTVVPIEGEKASPDSLMLIVHDTARQRALEENLIQAAKLSALGEIVARAAHELNNPITAILGYGELLKGTATDDSQRQRFDRMLEETHRCRRIVENLLTFSRRAEHSRRPVDINGLVGEALSLYEYALRLDEIEVDVKLDPDLPQLKVSAQDIQRAFLNILNNAHQALLEVGDRPRRLSISTSLSGPNVRIGFRDNGPGISEEARTRLFDPFFTTKPLGQGIGLGLSIAHGIVADHCGRIEVESAPGHGATFTILLPVTP